MVVWLTVPRFVLRVLTDSSVDLDAQPWALIDPRSPQLNVMQRTLPAARAGVMVGMPLTKAMAACADLQVSEFDRGAAERAFEQLCGIVEAQGAAIEPQTLGSLVFQLRPISALYGGDDAAARAVLAAVATRWPDARAGIGPNPFVASVAARQAAAGSVHEITSSATQTTLAQMPVRTLPALDTRLSELFDALGIDTLGQLAAIDDAALRARFGDLGVLLAHLARGDDPRRVMPREPAVEIVESMQFPDPVGSLPVLEHALTNLVERLLTRSELVDRSVVTLALRAQTVGDAVWSDRIVLRSATNNVQRLTVAIAPRLAGLSAPALTLELAVIESIATLHVQAELASEHGQRPEKRSDALLERAIAHVQFALGDTAVAQVLELDSDGQVPERQAALVPRASRIRKQPG